MAKLTESQKMKFEEKCILIDSELFDGVIYAIDRKGKGMHIISGNKEIKADAVDVIPFLQEALEVWEVHGTEA